MSRLQACPSCQHENSTYLAVCRQCGASLKSEVETTIALFPTSKAEDIRQSYLLRQTKLSDGYLALYIAGEKQPLTVECHDTVILGRSPDTQSEAMVDLTAYQGHQLGVSRRHAAIRVTDDGDVTFEDQGSINGTWLNGIRLVPGEPRSLRNGDLVQLGYLVLYIYFQEKSAEQGS